MTILSLSRMAKFSSSSPPSFRLFFTITTLLFLLPLKSSSSSSSSSVTVDTNTLLQFKSHLKDPAGYLTSWKHTTPPCQFFGISCNPITGKITNISLNNLSLTGKLTPSLLSNLDHLTSLVITSNHIHGRIPPEFSDLHSLRVLNLSFNRMVGKVPDLSQLKSLEVLDLSSNYFSGNFPSWIVNLPQLVSLALGNNLLFNEAPVPHALGDLHNLTYLFLGNCNLVGEIPEQVFRLNELTTLDLSRNKLSGSLPRSVGSMRRLTKLELYANNLTGELPRELGNLTLLQEMDISANKFHGELPVELGNLKNLMVFQCYDNYFSGPVPVGFADLEHLVAISLYRNGFSGEFPSDFGRIAQLNSFDISENNFSGRFPSYLCQTGNLQFLLALQNSFSGELPSSYADCKSLVRLRLNNNRFTGHVPDGLWSLPNVTIIDFSDNGFQGGISAQIAGSTSLSELILLNNRFSGEIPSEIGDLRRIERLYLSNNTFSGEIPAEIGELKNLSSLQLQGNKLEGPIPSSLHQCSRLADLNLAGNSLSAGIPDTFWEMSSLNSLNLSTNMLTGSIPESLGKLKLSLIDLSYNQLSGVIPPDLLEMGNGNSFVGNERLCIDDDQNNTKAGGVHGHGVVGMCGDGVTRRRSKRRPESSKLALAFIVLAFMVILLSVLLLLNYKSYKLHTERRVGDGHLEEGMVKNDGKWRIESFHPLELNVDEVLNLGEDNLIGSGGSGKVYRMDLKNGRTVAVKQMYRTKDPSKAKAVVSEMEIMGRIRHRNVLKLYACLVKDGRSYLVVEFMANGNLFEVLHMRKKSKDGKTEQLDWAQRYRIALGVAKGIAYLHHDCCPPIIHRDIKSSNILVDENNEPKIADFGAAKYCVQTDSTMRSEMNCLAGTHGYMAPEMAYNPNITEKCDVYSFGVVLLELVTGKRAIEQEGFGEERDIVRWVCSQMNNQRESELLDKAVASSEAIKENMTRVLKVATVCTSKAATVRPSMRDVVKMLAG